MFWGGEVFTVYVYWWDWRIKVLIEATVLVCCVGAFEMPCIFSSFYVVLYIYVDACCQLVWSCVIPVFTVKEVNIVSEIKNVSTFMPSVVWYITKSSCTVQSVTLHFKMWVIANQYLYLNGISKASAEILLLKGLTFKLWVLLWYLP